MLLHRTQISRILIANLNEANLHFRKYSMISNRIQINIKLVTEHLVSVCLQMDFQSKPLSCWCREQEEVQQTHFLIAKGVTVMKQQTQVFEKFKSVTSIVFRHLFNDTTDDVQCCQLFVWSTFVNNKFVQKKSIYTKH